MQRKHYALTEPIPLNLHLSRRVINAFGFGACVLLLLYGYYLEVHEGLPPCPLCTLQRFTIAALGLVFLAAAVHDPRATGARVYAGVIAGIAAIGAGIAARHVWLLNAAPEEAVACLPGLSYLTNMLPLKETLRLVLLESGRCGGVDWSFLGLSIPGWTLISFVVLGALGTVRNWVAERTAGPA